MHEFELVDFEQRKILHRPTNKTITITGPELHDVLIEPAGTPATPPGEPSFLEKVNRFCRLPRVRLRP